MRHPCLVLLIFGSAAAAAAQTPPRHYTEGIETRAPAEAPVLGYTLRVDPADLSALTVELRIRHAPDTLRLGMVAHPEYDNHPWRLVDRIDVTGPRGASVAREDSALWRVIALGGESVVRYRIHLPPESGPLRPAWHSFLSPSGGLIGSYQTLMYPVGATLAPARVTLDLPPGWRVATGLEPTADPDTFFAPNAFVLEDAPILVGALRAWRYQVDDVPHRVAWWPAPDAVPFDTLALVDGLRRISEQAARLFGRLPYREYDWLIQDRAYGALEHLNSVTLGAPSNRLARDMHEFFSGAAHEYVHTWNLMRLRPAAFGDVDYRPPPRARELWWSEGVTMYYADLLLRRAGLPTFDSTRTAHLESLIARYLAQPGNARFSAESVSVVSYAAAPDALGDDNASTHLQGELLGTWLGFRIADATGGRRSLADLMRALLARYSGPGGFTTADVERAAREICRCRVRDLFDRYVRSAHPMDFDAELARVGLRLRTHRAPATDSAGHPYADLRVSA
ncbi:MAG TPA: hypothetical protein VNH46_06530, partial [Gemmatimonadales bacterium]|nr:hypothetical protein [Gemmatimonadales bacterium]